MDVDDDEVHADEPAGSPEADVDPRLTAVDLKALEEAEDGTRLRSQPWPLLRDFLAAHGYSHWGEAEEAKSRGGKRRRRGAKDEDEGEDGAEDGASNAEELEERRHAMAGALMRELRDHVRRQFGAFLQALTGTAPGTGPGGRDLADFLGSAIHPRRHAAYLRRKKAFEDENAGLDDGGEGKHPGVREVRRILEAMNALPGPKFDGWPPAVDGDGGLDISYTHGETYGVFWNTTTVAPQGAPRYVSEHSADHVFVKRQPIRTVFGFKDVRNGPALAVHAWHPPAPSASHKDHRGRDFPTFVKYCQAVRKSESEPLALLCSDLNINTLRDDEDIENCEPRLPTKRFFQGVCGPSLYGGTDVLVPQVQTHSTLANSAFTPADPLIAMLHRKVNAVSDAAWGGRFSKDGLLRHIEGFKKPMQNARFGCSAYDKILPIRSNAGPWRLWQRDTAVAPFPAALASQRELDLFQFPASMPQTCRDLLGLFQRDKPALLDVLRRHRPLRRGDDPILPLMADAKLMSDHLPMYADLVFISDGAPAEIVREEVDLDDGPIGAVDAEVERLCVEFESARENAAQEAARGKLLEVWDKGNSRWNTASLDRIVGALQHHDTVRLGDVRSAALAAEEWQEQRPGKKAARSGQSVEAALHEAGLQVIANGGGGDCLFRSLAQLLTGDEAHHADVRRAVVNHLDDLLSLDALPEVAHVGPVSRDDFRYRIRLLLDWHRAQWPHVAAYRASPGLLDGFRQYVLAMRRGGCWGDLIALAAASHLFGVRFRLYVGLPAGVWTDEVDFADGAADAIPEHALLNWDNTHFVALRPDSHAAPALVPPPRWAELLAERRQPRVGVIIDEAARMEERRKEKTVTAASTGVLPAPTGAVYHWPAEVFWTLEHVRKFPRALFLFGENAASQGTKAMQSTTQAVIRPADNAHGIRTCWQPGGTAGFAPGGMLDSELETRNKQAIHDDCAAAWQRLNSGNFDTLVVPRDSSGKLSLGTGVAALDQYAPLTYGFLCDTILALEKAAEELLKGVRLYGRGTGVTAAAAEESERVLYLGERSAAMAAIAATTADRVFHLRTSLLSPFDPDGGFFSDADPSHARMLEEDFDEIEALLASGEFDRVEIPMDERGRPTLGDAGRLAEKAPELKKLLDSRLERLFLLSDDLAAGGIPMRKKKKRLESTNHDEDESVPVESDDDIG